MPTGTLIVKPMSARLTHDTEYFSKMDPYCTVKLGSQSQSTSVCSSGGKSPNWPGASLSFRVFSEDVINVEVWDKDLISKNDLVGQGSISLASIFNADSRNPSFTCQLYYKGKSAGEVYIQFEWYPETSKEEKAKSGGFGYPNPYPYQQPPSYQQPYQFQPPPYHYQPPPIQPPPYQPPPQYTQPLPQYPAYQQPAPLYRPPPPPPPPVYQQPTTTVVYTQPPPVFAPPTGPAMELFVEPWHHHHHHHHDHHHHGHHHGHGHW